MQILIAHADDTLNFGEKVRGDVYIKTSNWDGRNSQWCHHLCVP